MFISKQKEVNLFQLWDGVPRALRPLPGNANREGGLPSAPATSRRASKRLIHREKWARYSRSTPEKRLPLPTAITGAVLRAVLACAGLATLAAPAAAQCRNGPTEAASPANNAFIQVTPTEGRAPVRLAVSQVVRIARAEGYTVIDTTAYVQQRTVEPVEAVARRLAAAGQRLVALTDLRDARTYLAADRVVLVREPYEQHAAGARAAVVVAGLRFNNDVAVRETVEQVMAALERGGPAAPEAPAAR